VIIVTSCIDSNPHPWCLSASHNCVCATVAFFRTLFFFLSLPSQSFVCFASDCSEKKRRNGEEDEEEDHVEEEEEVATNTADVEDDDAETAGEEGEELPVTAAIEPYATGGSVVAAPTEYRDITELLNLPQVEAARRLKLPMSTLSKRWKEAVRIRKWPYRQVAKLDKEIMTLLHNIPPRGENDAAPTPPEIEQALGILLRRRQEELRPVRIRM
jgi:hypothetical protein